MKRKSGISLVTLVITVIVMIILAGIIVVSVSESNIFDKAKTAVDLTDKKQIEQLATTAWAEAYLDGARSQADLQTAVEYALGIYELNDKYAVKVTEKGIEDIYIKNYKLNVDYTKSIKKEETAYNYFTRTGTYPVLLTSNDITKVSLKEARFYVKDMSNPNSEFVPAEVAIYPTTKKVSVVPGGEITSSAATYILFYNLTVYDSAVLKVECVYNDGTVEPHISDVIDMSTNAVPE